MFAAYLAPPPFISVYALAPPRWIYFQGEILFSLYGGGKGHWTFIPHSSNRRVDVSQITFLPALVSNLREILKRKTRSIFFMSFLG